jgi:hypothetical protein
MVNNTEDTTALKQCVKIMSSTEPQDLDQEQADFMFDTIQAYNDEDRMFDPVLDCALSDLEAFLDKAGSLEQEITEDNA